MYTEQSNLLTLNIKEHIISANILSILDKYLLHKPPQLLTSAMLKNGGQVGFFDRFLTVSIGVLAIAILELLAGGMDNSMSKVRLIICYMVVYTILCLFIYVFLLKFYLFIYNAYLLCTCYNIDNLILSNTQILPIISS